MSDLISREDAKETIDTMICDNKWVCECAINSLPSEDVVRIEVYKELYEKYVELKHELEQPQNDNWIPVSEGLPSEEGYYLVTWEDEDGRCTLCDYYAKWLGRFEQEVIAWQPLPTPYKGGDTE